MSASSLNSIVEYYSEHQGYKCGYCKSPDTNFSYGMWAHALSVSDYQDLIDRGWRRSGKFCYKPTMDVTCCPMYTIRCRALEFKPTKSQKKVLKRMNKFLKDNDLGQQSGDARKMSTGSIEDEDTHVQGGEQFVKPSRPHVPVDLNAINQCNVEQFDKSAGESTQDSSQSQAHDVANMETELKVKTDICTTTEKKVSVCGQDPEKPPCKKAKQLRIERKLEKLQKKGIDITTLDKNCIKNKEKQLTDILNELPEEFKTKLEIRLVRTTPPSPEYLASAQETHEVYVKYQMTIHDDKREKCAENKFNDFLVKSPLLEEYTDDGPTCGYGSFHQQYWLSGRLIAVGVLDILPKCVSSVYFFYDPEFMSLSLGTYGALREIALTQELHAQSPQLQYYYMGFYIHSCRKMRYKGNFSPSDLLCPETYKWQPLPDCIPKLEASPYSRLDPDIDSIDENPLSESELAYLPIYCKGAVIPYKVYKRKYAKKDYTEKIMQYAKLVGAKAAKNLILVR